MKTKNKPIIVITHERSGTHLLINIINYNELGKFYTIGFIPDNLEHNLKNYKDFAFKSIISLSYQNDIVCKSHHQVEFMEKYLEFIFERYNVIYLYRDVKDVLVSYYNFLMPIENFPEFKDWIFMKPSEVGEKFKQDVKHVHETDPHVIIEPENYIDRWKIHTDGWLKHKNEMLVLKYEDILNDFENQKITIEDYLGREIGTIPDINDKRFPNFNPGKGIVGGWKDLIDDELNKKIEKYL